MTHLRSHSVAHVFLTHSTDSTALSHGGTNVNITATNQNDPRAEKKKHGS